MLKKSKNGALSGRIRTALCALALAGACAGGAIGGALIAGPLQAEAADKENKPVILRVCNWEEYIDLGDWDEEETIELDSGDIIGEREACGNIGFPFGGVSINVIKVPGHFDRHFVSSR